MTQEILFLLKDQKFSIEGHGHMNTLRGGQSSSPICPRLQTHGANLEKSGKCPQ